MSSATTRKPAPLTPSATVSSTGLGLFQSPLLWGHLLTAGFYLLVAALPNRELVSRLFCSHWIVYAEMGLFFCGVAALVTRTIGLVQERRSLKMIVIDGAS